MSAISDLIDSVDAFNRESTTFLITDRCMWCDNWFWYWEHDPEIIFDNGTPFFICPKCGGKTRIHRVSLYA